MSTVYPHSRSDLALAPVLIRIERNLERLRECDDLVHALATAGGVTEASPHARAEQVVRAATHGVSLHGLIASPTPGLDGVFVAHGEYRVSLLLGSRISEFVRHGVDAALPAV